MLPFKIPTNTHGGFFPERKKCNSYKESFTVIHCIKKAWITIYYVLTFNIFHVIICDIFHVTSCNTFITDYILKIIKSKIFHVITCKSFHVNAGISLLLLSLMSLLVKIYKPSKFRVMVAVDSPKLFLATALYSPPSCIPPPAISMETVWLALSEVIFIL